MTRYLLLGFLMGLRHALEADHLAAVAALATRERAVGRTALRGVAWGAGHGVTLLAVGAVCLLFRLAVPEGAARLIEGAVGCLLVLLGWGVLRRLLRPNLRPSPAPEPQGTWRAVGIGMAHGLAGSAALLVLVASTLRSPLVGLAYVACFSLGAILGMAALSAAIALPLRGAGGLRGRAPRAVEGLIGLGTVLIGGWLIYRVVS
jgi:high-affinity nickel-transport protein